MVVIEFHFAMIPDEKRIIDLTVSQLREIIEETVRKHFLSQPLQTELSDIISIDEAAEFTHLARQTIYQKVCERKIPFIKKVGSKKLLFSRKALYTWLLEDSEFK
jgi:excisionase family DNA binding protein